MPHSKECTLHALGCRFELLREVAASGVRVAFVRVTPTARDVDVASPQRLLFHETGRVEELVVENVTATRVLVPEHLVVRGGAQTRALERTIVAGPHGSARVPVRCVERGRWEVSSGRTFDRYDYASHVTRSELTSARAESFVRSSRYTATQAAVWDHVDRELERTRVTSATSSYADVLDESRRTSSALAGVPVPPEANAVVVMASTITIEMFASCDALRERFPLFVADATARNDADHATNVLLQALHASAYAMPAVEGTLGEAFTIVGRVRGSALFLDGALVHAGLVA